MEFYAYILASFRRTLYIGVTNDLARRVTQHRGSSASTFTGKYRVHRLVYYESADSPIVAIEREKQLKGWRREKKLWLIETLNPEWRDLAEDIFGPKIRAHTVEYPAVTATTRPRGVVGDRP